MNKIYFRLLQAEWDICKSTDLQPSQGVVGSYIQECAARYGVPWNQLTGEQMGTYAKELEEVWEIPRQWLDEQPSTTEIKDD